MVEIQPIQIVENGRPVHGRQLAMTMRCAVLSVVAQLLSEDDNPSRRAWRAGLVASRFDASRAAAECEQVLLDGEADEIEPILLEELRTLDDALAVLSLLAEQG